MAFICCNTLHFQVGEGIHFFIGFAMGNCIIIEAPEGLIVIDTLEGNINYSNLTYYGHVAVLTFLPGM